MFGWLGRWKVQDGAAVTDGQVLQYDGTNKYWKPATLPTPENDVVVIAETELGSAASTITFSSIPATYRNLLLVVHSKGATSDTDALLVRFNNDSGGNYSYQKLSVVGAGASGARSTAQTSISLSYAGGDHEIWIPAYRQTTHIKSMRSTGGYRNTTPELQEAWGVWNSTAAITRIDLICGSSNNFDTGTIATLYGLAAA